MARTFSADTIDEATETFRFIHTMIARGAARLMAQDARIKPAGAVMAIAEELFERAHATRPQVMRTYQRAAVVLGIRRGDMTYPRFLSYVEPEVRLQLTTDRKVAG